MKLKMTCAVEGAASLSQHVEIVDGLFRYLFVCDEQNSLSAVVLTTAIEHPDRFASRVAPASGDAPASVTIEMDDDLVAEMIRRMQALESHLAFRLPIERVRWDSALIEVVSETPAERQSLPALSIHVDRAGARRAVQEATERTLGAAVGACERFYRNSSPYPVSTAASDLG